MVVVVVVVVAEVVEAVEVMVVAVAVVVVDVAVDVATVGAVLQYDRSDPCAGLLVQISPAAQCGCFMQP